MKLWRDNQIPGNKSKAKGTALGGRGDNINVDIRKVKQESSGWKNFF